MRTPNKLKVSCRSGASGVVCAGFAALQQPATVLNSVFRHDNFSTGNDITSV